MTALVLAQRAKLKEAKRGAGIYGDTLWEKHEDLVTTENMEALEKLKGWKVLRKAGVHSRFSLCVCARARAVYEFSLFVGRSSR